MLILTIETTGPVSSVALNIDGKIVFKRNDDNFSHLKELMPMVDNLMKETGVMADAIDAIAVSQGPGSFTGIRIGISSAKALAQVWDKKMIEVPTLASFAFGDYSWADKNYLYCPVLDAKMHQVYAAAYEKDSLNPLVEGGAYDIDEFLNKLKNVSANYDGVIFFGDGKKVYMDALDGFEKNHIFAPEDDNYQKASSCARAAQLLYEQGKFKSCYDFQPEYFRLPEAERKFKTKTMVLRNAEEKDIDVLEVIEKKSFTDPWSKEALLEEIENSKNDEKHHFIVAGSGDPKAYVIAFILPNVMAEIWSVATAPESRRQGIARKLLLDVIDKAKKARVSVIQLEVRAGNKAAICMYETLGFKKTGERKEYYADGEDAILMDREI